MRKGTAEKVVRRNITLPESFAKRLESLKARRGSASESEILRHAISLLEAATGPDMVVVIRDTKTGKEKEVLVP